MNFVSLSVIGLTYECQVMEAASWFSCGFGSTCQDLGTKEADPREPPWITSASRLFPALNLYVVLSLSVALPTRKNSIGRTASTEKRSRCISRMRSPG